jgi:hypothetical protein
MKITVSEALRLKNDVSRKIQMLQSETHRAPLGITKENGTPINDTEDAKRFQSAIERLEKGLSYSHELNGKIAEFNRSKGIDSKVRDMQNNKMLLSIYENALPKTKAAKTNRFENLGNGKRETISVEYQPTMTATDVKSKISHYKTKYRSTQNEIEILNQEKIDISFSFEDVEALASE